MLVSIIITSYNYDNYIEECVLSCLNQKDFTNYEIILVDDGSKDSTIEKVEKYQERIKIFTNPNMGIEYASNFGIKKSKGKYFVRVDADDKLDKNYLNKMVPIIENGNYSFIYSEYEVIDGKGKCLDKFILPPFDKKEVLDRGDFLATGTLYRKSEVVNVGLYNEREKNCGLENYELILKLLENNAIGYCLHTPLFLYRRHQTNLSEIKINKIIEYGNKLAVSNGRLRYTTNENHPYGLKL